MRWRCAHGHGTVSSSELDCCPWPVERPDGASCCGAPVRTGPYTVAELVVTLERMVAQDPSVAAWPVHVLDLAPDAPVVGSGLVSVVEGDMFDDDQGMVVSLIADPGCVLG